MWRQISAFFIKFAYQKKTNFVFVYNSRLMIKSEVFAFLNELKNHNNKEWFDANRERYESTRSEFKIFTENLLQNCMQFDADLKGLEVKNCLFRINRDVRFSQNKDPYKINYALSLTKGGKKTFYAGYYFHLQPGECFAGGGIYGPQPDILKAVRNEIYFHYSEFESILSEKKFRKHYSGLDKIEMLKNPPKGFADDSPAMEYLKHKHFVISTRFTDHQIQAKTFLSEITEKFEALHPFIAFLNRAVDNR